MGYGAAMSDKPPAPDTCTTMVEVRAGVDALDRELIALIGRRMRFMEAAARIKRERSQVRDEARKAQVIANAVAGARSHGVPKELATELWERLVEGSIAYEFAVFDRR